MTTPLQILDIRPVAADLWNDLEALFGPCGAYGGCWCMWWRVKSSEFDRNGNKGNKAAMQGIVSQGEVPGLLGYLDGKPVGWLSLGPREVFGRLSRSPLFKPIDGEAVWSLVCFFIHREYRNAGVATQLLAGACDYAKTQGARILEAYPVDTGGLTKAQASLFTGTAALFKKAGFKKAARRKATRPIFRKRLV
ncbi:MAG: GNAT family N-acetyltransferase [Chloroflexi bacterium]|nr:GNAT family N-acetyltransferase [Chloroflexota bacterium]MQC26856.1 GNAT family N-acetyltransferase [Chloroflexota bacterium]